MEISKALQEEILSVQENLKNAIRDHQVCVEKLKDDANNTNILEQIQQIQLHIVTLGRRQKQVVQRLRKEVETFKADNANGSKVSIASLLGTNNNNHIIKNNEAKSGINDAEDVENINGLDTRLSKEDYEEEIRNSDVTSAAHENDCSNRERSNSVETISYEDDVVEVSPDENSNEKQDIEEECKAESLMQLSFLGSLGLITTTKCTELQNRRAERKRRSTANPQFVYSNWELPSKGRRFSYLQSAGGAPQTRQSTARSNEPSPPPGKILTNKSIPSSTKNLTKSLISTQKSTTRPNILRIVSENKNLNKSTTENGASQVQLPTVRSAGSKVVHIPGLPSSLTIERIEGDSAVCISCRNPGTLTVCQQCSLKYHVSCHSISPPPLRICPKCALNTKVNDLIEDEIACKKENELAAAVHTTGVIGKAREDSEVNKASRGFHKVNAAKKRNLLSSALGINQLPSSTFLIPISTSPTPSLDQSDTKNPATVSRTNQAEITIVDQQSQSGSIAFVQSESHLPRSTYKLPVGRDKHQSYLIVKKVSDSGNAGGMSENRQTSSTYHNRQTDTQSMSILNYQLSSPCGYSTTHGEPDVPVSHPSRLFINLSNRNTESNTSSSKKPNNRSIPGLNRIIFSEDKLLDLAESSDEEIYVVKKDQPKSSGLLHSLFAGNNKSNTVTSSSSQSQGTSTGRTDNTNSRQLSQDQQPKSNEGTEQLRRFERSNSTEHVKLEEAHISAPPRAKLKYSSCIDKKGCNSETSIRRKRVKRKLNSSVQTSKKVKKVVKEVELCIIAANTEPAVIQPVIEVTIDDTDEPGSESQGESSKETDKCEAKDDGNVPSSPAEQTHISEQLQNFYTVIKDTLDFIFSERKDSSTQNADCLKSSSTSSKNSNSSQSQSNINELQTEVSIPNDKADAENKDLPSCYNKRLPSDEDNAPTVERLVSTDLNSGSTVEIKDTVMINSVSEENIKVLEDFESAMLEVDKRSAS